MAYGHFAYGHDLVFRNVSRFRRRPLFGSYVFFWLTNIHSVDKGTAKIEFQIDACGSLNSLNHYKTPWEAFL